MIKIRDFLEQNKIFIDTILALLAVIIAWQSFKIDNKQTEILIKEKMPKINIFVERTYNEDESYQRELIINNSGDDISEFSFRIATFYEAEYLKTNMEKDKIEIPVFGNYTGTIIENAVQGNLSVSTGYKNQYNFDKLDIAMQKYYSEKVGYINLNEVNYIKVNYKDVFDKEHEEYYKERLGSVSKLDNKSGKEKFEIYDQTPLNNGKIDANNQSVRKIKNIIKDELE